jgi:chromosome segregation ATPase
MKDQLKDAARKMKELTFEAEDLQGVLQDPNASEDEKDGARQRLEEIAGDKEHWQVMGEEASERIGKMGAEKKQMEEEEARAKAAGEEAEREERKHRIEQAKEAFARGEQEYHDAKDELELLKETLALETEEAAKEEISEQIRDVKSRMSALEAAYDAVKHTMDDLVG